MKKMIFICCVAMATVGKAQNNNAENTAGERGWYLKAGGGYFISSSPGQFPNVGGYPPQDVRESVDISGTVTSVQSQKVLTGSYGAGIRGGLTGGFQFNRYMAVELSARYYQSNSNLMTHIYATLDNTTPLPGALAGEITTHGHVSVVDVAPSLVISPGFTGRINPYVSIGVVVPVWGKLFINTAGYMLGTTDPANPSTANITKTNIARKDEINPNPTIGVQGAIGLTCKLTKKLSLFAELEYRNVPVKSKNKEITAYSQVTTDVSGVNVLQTVGLNDLPVAVRETNYQTTLNANSNAALTSYTSNQNGFSLATVAYDQTGNVIYKDPTKPSDDLKSYINIGGLGLNVGLRLNLWK